MMDFLSPWNHHALAGVAPRGARRVANSCLLAAIGLLGVSCDRPETATGAPSGTELAGRMVRSSVRINAWKDGAIPYVIGSGDLNPTLRSMLRSAMNDWESGSEGRLRFFEVAASYPEKKLTINLVASPDLPLGGSAYAYVSGTPADGMTLNLVQYPFRMVQPRNPRPSVLGVPGGAYEILLHELGHVLGLAHEQENPLARYMTAVVEGNRAACPADLHYSWGTPTSTLLNSTGSVVVPKDQFNLDVDVNSVMWSEGYNCEDGSSVRFYDWNGNLVGSKLDGPSPGDFDAIKAIYTLPTASRLWDVTSVVNLEFAPMNGTTRTAMESFASSRLQEVASRWFGSLDPRTGAIAGRSPTIRIVNRSSVPGAGSVLRISVDPNLFDPVPWKVTCNSETKTTYCEVRLDSRMFKNTYSEPINQETMILNVMQAAIGSALGISSKSVQSAVYENNAWSAKRIYPTTRDIDALRARYGTFGEGMLPLIEVRGNLVPGQLFTKYVHGWDEVERSPKGTISGVSVLGSVLRGASSLEQSVPSVSMNLGRQISQYTIGYEMVWGAQSLAQAVQSLPAGVCPAEAVQSAQGVYPVAGSVKLPKLAVQASATFPDQLKASWSPNAQIWILSSSPIYDCQVALGYYRAR